MAHCLALLVVVSVALAAPPADSATVRVSSSESVVVFAAAPGEQNDVQIHLRTGRHGKIRSAVVQDAGALLSAGEGCTPDGATVRCEGLSRAVQLSIHLADMGDDAGVTCEGPPFARAVVVTGGDGDDVVTALCAAFAEMDGEAGNDRLEATNAHFSGGDGDDELIGNFTTDYIEGDAGSDVIVGRAGRDLLEGGTENDHLMGGDGGDQLYGGGRFGRTRGSGNDELDGGDSDDYLHDSDRKPGPDLISGGTGIDLVGSYVRQNSPVQIDLSRRDGQGREGEGDSFTHVEAVHGSRAADVLLGTDGTDILRGNGGDDRVEGLGGDDIVGASQGIVDAGKGDDRVLYPAWDRSGWADANFSCGAGADLVKPTRSIALSGRRPDGAGRGALVGDDCEQLRFGGFSLSPLPVEIRRNGEVTFEIERRHSDPTHTLSLRRPEPPFEKLAKRHIRGRRVTLQLPPRVVDERRTAPVTIRAKLGGPRELWIPRIWRFQLTQLR